MFFLVWGPNVTNAKQKWDISIIWGGPLGGLPCIEIPALKKWLRIPWIGPGEKQGDGKWLGEGVGIGGRDS